MARSKKRYRLGSRSSQLALVQAESVVNQLKLPCDIVEIQGYGDIEISEALYAIDASHQGLFTKELEIALLDGRIDFAVHSIKDLPTTQPQGLLVVSILKREDPSDVLISQGKLPLKHAAVVGTSSLRREAQLLNARPDLCVVSIRGNVPTRVKKVREGECDAVVLAQAGISRLKLNLDKLFVMPLDYVSAPGQGALAIEIRSGADAELKNALLSLNHAKTAQEVTIERRVLRELEGGCTLPLGVRVKKSGQWLELRAFLGVLATRHGSDQRKWRHFESFDISGSDEETLVSQTVEHLKRILKGGT